MSKSAKRDRSTPFKDEATGRPPFQSRKTFADYVKDNLNLKHRKSYFQRMIAICQHKQNHDTFITFIRNRLNEILDKCNANINGERIVGIFLSYKENSVFVVEGSEDVLGIFLVELHKVEDDLFAQLKVLTFLNNIGNTYFNKFVWRTFEPPSSTEELKEDSEEGYEAVLNDMMGKLDRLFRALGTEFARRTIIEDPEACLSSSYEKILPPINAIQYLLKAKNLFEISEYAKCFQKLPPTADYDCSVWPIPFDHTPLDVFKTGKYDVNLTFGDTV